MGWNEAPSINWENIARKMMVATRRFRDCPNEGNKQTLIDTLNDCERITRED